jgi:hypothetical protein
VQASAAFSYRSPLRDFVPRSQPVPSTAIAHRPKGKPATASDLLLKVRLVITYADARPESLGNRRRPAIVAALVDHPSLG